MKSLILSAQYFISLCTLQWFCGIIYTPIKTLITYSLVQCSLSLAQLNCFFLSTLKWKHFAPKFAGAQQFVWWVSYNKIPLFSPHRVHPSYSLSFHFIYLFILRYRVSIYMIVPPYTTLSRDNKNAHRICLPILFIYGIKIIVTTTTFIWHCWECKREKNRKKTPER